MSLMTIIVGNSKIVQTPDRIVITVDDKENDGELVDKSGNPIELGLLTEEVLRVKGFTDEEQIKETLSKFKYYNKRMDGLYIYSEQFVRQNGWK